MDLTQITQCPTLAAVDDAIERTQSRDGRPYVGMSSIGGGCDRRTWYAFRWTLPSNFSAATIRKFDDGHAGEAVMAARLRLVDGIELHTENADGSQFGFSDHAGHTRGHMDGAIRGLLHDPETWHVWEHKQCSPSVYFALSRAKTTHGPDALKNWNETYYGQAQLYLHYSGLRRHYLTCSTAGGREYQSVLTDYDADYAALLVERARNVVYATSPPTQPYKSGYFYCRQFCDYRDLCHKIERVIPAVNCRTCIFSKPEQAGGWSCGQSGSPRLLSVTEQRGGCSAHLFRPDLMPVSAIEAADDSTWIAYEDGTRNAIDPANGTLSRDFT